MSNHFSDLVKEAQKNWTPETWAVYNAASIAFAAKTSGIQAETTEPEPTEQVLIGSPSLSKDHNS